MPNPNLPINARYNTYIGARYVPKFADPTEWSAQNKYDPLTIVTYQGNSYTSKTFVPVGIDINNSTYWAETGNYNAQVEQYRQQVIQLTETVNEKINNMQRVLYYPKVTQNLNNEGLCGFYKINDTDAILFDAGREDNVTDILDSLSRHGVSSIVGIVISHYHADHIGVLPHISEYVTKPLTLFLPRASTRFPETQGALNQILQTFPTATVIYPEENSTYQFEGDSLTFVNCGVQVIAYWDATTANYNNFSMVTYLKHGNTTIAFTGDIDSDAQNRIYNNGLYRNVEFLTLPHHGWQSTGNINLAISFAPKFAYVGDTYLTSKELGDTDPFLAGISSVGCKLFKGSVSDSDVSINITPNGVIPPVGANYYTHTDRAGNTITLYVDSENTSPYGNGTQGHPFKGIDEALAVCQPGLRYIIHIIHNEPNLPIIITGQIAVDIWIDNPLTTNQIIINKCAAVAINGQNNLTCGVLNVSDSADVYLQNIKPSSWCEIFRSSVHMVGIQVSGSNSSGYAFTVNSSIIDMLNCGSTGNATTGILLNGSTFKYNGNWLTNFENVEHMLNVSGGNNVAPVVSSTNGLLKYIGTSNTPVMGYDTTQSKPVMVYNGNVIPLT